MACIATLRRVDVICGFAARRAAVVASAATATHDRCVAERRGGPSTNFVAAVTALSRRDVIGRFATRSGAVVAGCTSARNHRAVIKRGRRK